MKAATERLNIHDYPAYLCIALAIIFFWLTFPQFGSPIEAGLDPSWKLANALAFTQRLETGKDILFTYGPLGFLRYPQPVGNTLKISAAFYAIFHLLCVSLLVAFAWSFEKTEKLLKKPLRLALAFFFLNLNQLTTHQLGQKIFFLAVLCLLYYHRHAFYPGLFLSSALCGLGFLIKADYGLISLTAVLAYCIYRLVAEGDLKTCLLSLGSILAVFALFWAIRYSFAQDTAASIWRYLYAIKEFSLGHSSALSYGAPDSRLLVCAGFFAIGLLFGLAKKNADKPALLFLAVSLLPFLAMFKYSHTREDHIVLFNLFLLNYFLIFFLVSRLGIKSLLALILASSCLYAFELNTRGKPHAQAYTFAAHLQKAYSLRGRAIFQKEIFSYPRYRQELIRKSKENLEGTVLDEGLLKTIGKASVDTYPWELSYIYKYRLNWRPRPVFQSYVAYTPWLDSQNSGFLASGRAAEYILWHDAFRGLDERYLLNDEPQTMLALLSNYAPLSFKGNITLFKRKGAGESSLSKPRIAPARDYGWDEWINVPAAGDGIIRAKTAIKRTLLQKMKLFFYREEPIFMEYRLEDGTAIRHRIVIDNAISGLWISPYVTAFKTGDSPQGFLEGKPTLQVRFTHSPADSFSPVIKIAWESVK